MLTLNTVFVFVVCFLLPLVEVPRWRRLRAGSTSMARLAHYRAAIILLWLLAAAAAWLAAPAQLHDAPSGIHGMAWLRDSAASRWLVQAGTLLLVGAMAAHAWRSRFDTELQRQYAAAAQALQFMLPVGKRERRWWGLLAISAGVCEELVYRGFLLAYFGGQGAGLAGAWLLSTLAFGLAHAYQGLGGIVRSALVGAILGLVAIASGHLALAIVLHIAIDLLPLAYYRPAGPSVEGVLEVGDQVGGVFNADGDADQGIGNTH